MKREKRAVKPGDLGLAKASIRVILATPRCHWILRFPLDLEADV